MLLLIFICVLGAVVSAQQVIASSGSSGSAAGYSVDWTFGEPVVETFTGSNHILSQGFHQTELLATSLQDIKIPGLLVRVYPNPVGDWLMAEVARAGGFFRYELYDVTGHKMLQKSIHSSTEEINTGGFAPGMFFLSMEWEPRWAMPIKRKPVCISYPSSRCL